MSEHTWTTPSERPLRTWERGPVRTALVSTMRNRDQMAQVVAKQLSSRPDAVILELEAGIVANHDLAREIMAEVLTTVDYGSIQRAIKINPVGSEHCEKDLQAILPGRPDAVLMTLVKDPAEVRWMSDRLDQLEREHGYVRGTIRIWILVERARGVIKLLDVLEASDRVDLACFGPADLTADLGTTISSDREDLGAFAGVELVYGRSKVAYAAKAAGVLAIDTATINVRADATLHARVSRQLGYDGMVAISPNQIPVLLDAFTPSGPELDHARAAATAFRAAVAEGNGIANLEGEMISKSVYEGYERVLVRAGELRSGDGA